MTFGFTSAIDWLSWAVVLCGALKVAATLILLRDQGSAGLSAGRGRLLWWATKLTPLPIAPALVAIAWLGQDRPNLIGYSALLVFVVVAVPVAALRRRRSATG